MDFLTAEEKFQELQARVRRGEPMSEDQYQEELAKLMVQDDSGVFWSLEPGTGRWLYFNGTEWMAGTPPKQPAPAPVAPTIPYPTASAPAASDTSPYSGATPAPEPASQAPSYYVPSDVTRPVDYSGTYTGVPSYTAEPPMQTPSYGAPGTTGAPPSLEPEGMPTYVRMPEPETTSSVPTGGIPPRPVREASPLAVPGGDRAWLPFAFGALVLLLCAVVLFFGVRGLPQFGGNAANAVPTDEPTQEVTEVLPTATVELVPTSPPNPTEQVTAEPQPTTGAAQTVTATTTDILNIRSGPARTNASVGKLPAGQQVTVVGRNGDGTWLQIQIPNKTDLGWVSADFVTVTGDVNTLPVVNETGGGNTPPSPTETPTG